MPTATYNNSIEKGLQLLTLFTDERPAQSLAEISREAGMPKATALRFLNALTRQGFLRKDSAGAYRLGYRLIELGHLASDQLDLRTIALPYMGALRDALDEAVQIAVIDGTEAVYLEKVDCRQPVRLFTRAGRRAPLHAGACPRLLLAFAPDPLINLVLSERTERRQFTQITPTDPNHLRALIGQTRRDGYSLSLGELEAGSAALAVPLQDYSGNVVATLSVAGPVGRFGPERLPEILAHARHSAAQISREFGFVPTTRS